MWDAWRLLWSLLIGFFRSRASLEAENLALRQQIIVLRRTAPKRLSFNGLDRLIFVGLYRLFPDLRDALAVVRPETVIRWHRAGLEPIGVGGRGRDGDDRRCRLRFANYPGDEPCQSAMGSPADPWRVAQARHRYRANECGEWELGRIEARTGLRMMPTFPRSPLSFRTAGFPQYGWKAGFPSGAFPMIGGLSLLPACAVRRPVCIRPSCAS